jgi:hypothetical protein
MVRLHRKHHDRRLIGSASHRIFPIFIMQSLWRKKRERVSRVESSRQLNHRIIGANALLGSFSWCEEPCPKADGQSQSCVALSDDHFSGPGDKFELELVCFYDGKHFTSSSTTVLVPRQPTNALFLQHWNALENAFRRFFLSCNKKFSSLPR